MQILRRTFSKQASDKVLNDATAPAMASPSDSHEVIFDTCHRDGECKTDVIIRDPAAPWAHVCIVILSKAPADQRLFAAFGICGMPTALPCDLSAQEAANTAAEAAIAKLIPEMTMALIHAFREQWETALKRLQDRWKDLETKGYSADRLELFYGNTTVAPVIRYRKTKPGPDELVGVIYAAGAQNTFQSLSPYCEKAGRFGLITQQALASVEALSGHEKLELLAGENGRIFAAARTAFDRLRGRNQSVICRPLIGMDGISTGTKDVRTFLWSGDEGQFLVLTNSTVPGRWGLCCKLSLPSIRANIVFEGSVEGGYLIRRDAGQDNMFKSVDILDTCCGKLIDLLIATDLDVPNAVLPTLTAAFDPDHRVLAGRKIPLRYQRFVATLLDKPYASARKAAERAIAKQGKIAQKANAVRDLADVVADGAIFGQVRFRTLTKTKSKLERAGFALHVPEVTSPAGRMEPMKLGFVRSETGQGGRRNRQMVGLAGFKVARPLTPKHMAQLPALSDPDALMLVSDHCLDDDRRDVIEGAFRLSFYLDGGAKNPFLEAAPQIDFLSVGQSDARLRVTQIDVPNGPALLALAVVYPDRDRYYDIHKTGARFMVLRVGTRCHFSGGAALLSTGLNAPEDHRRMIESALAGYVAAKGWDIPMLMNGLDQAWGKMAKAVMEAEE